MSRRGPRSTTTATDIVPWDANFAERFRCSASVLVRHAGTLQVTTRHANATEARLCGEQLPVVVAVQVWEDAATGRRLHTVANRDVVETQERKYIAWRRRTCGGWRGEVPQRFALLDGLPPNAVETGCAGRWSPLLHRSLPQQVRREVEAALWLFRQLLGRDVLHHVLFAYIAFRRGPVVRIFLSDTWETSDGLLLNNEVAVLDARLLEHAVMRK